MLHTKKVHLTEAISMLITS